MRQTRPNRTCSSTGSGDCREGSHFFGTVPGSILVERSAPENAIFRNIIPFHTGMEMLLFGLWGFYTVIIKFLTSFAAVLTIGLCIKVVSGRTIPYGPDLDLGNIHEMQGWNVTCTRQRRTSAHRLQDLHGSPSVCLEGLKATFSGDPEYPFPQPPVHS